MFLYQHKTMDSRRPQSKKGAGSHYYNVKKSAKRQKTDVSDSSQSSVGSALHLSNKYVMSSKLKSPRPAKRGLHATPGKRQSSGKKQSVRQFCDKSVAMELASKFQLAPPGF